MAVTLYHILIKNNYYLVNGDLTGSWNGMPKDIIIVNWYFGKRDKNLPLFASRGHRQVIAGYYDGDVKKIDAWLDSAAKVKGVVGVMYTTWQSRFDDIEAFMDRVKKWEAEQ